jgi:hypothetical protein
VTNRVGNNENGSSELIVVIVIAVLIVGALGYVLFSRLQTNFNKTTTTSASQTTKLSHPGIIASELFAPGIDTSGAPVSPVASFTSSTPKIYVVLSLVNAKATQRIEYTRYLDGKFIDNGSIPIKDGAKYASFSYELLAGKTHAPGTYIVKVYTDGVYERSGTYTVK